MLTVTKIFEFEAAHHLPDYDGACRNIHGHSYKLEVEVEGPPANELSPSGMVYDFANLKSIVKNRILDFFDHSDLNGYVTYPTAEKLVTYIGENLVSVFKSNLVRVRLWETSNSYAEWRRE
jgi:6-pyruvoyltetrahydropterin/6-carboxytetrahydropterin synthase